MVYLTIKELSNIAEDVIMATSSLTKDMNDKVAAEIGYRSNAVRALCRITDVSVSDLIFGYMMAVTKLVLRLIPITSLTYVDIHGSSNRTLH
jgi:coatomer protein complex subunit gamma